MKLTKEIDLNFTLKDDNFSRVCKSSHGYIYERINGLIKYYEVFKIKEVETLIDFENKIGSGEFKHKYPKDNDFGVWAWCCASKERAYQYLEEINMLKI